MVVIRGRLEPEAGAVQIRALTVACDVQRAKPATVEANNVSAETSQRLTCDDSRVEMRHDADGVIVEVGARTRTIPTALRRALVYRDHGCRFPGCDLPFGQAHHIKHWAQGGPTTLWNLVLLCRRHHRSVHEEGFRVERRENGELQFRSPHGHVLPQVPPTPKTPADAAAEVRARNTAAGVSVHPDTATPGWDGRPLNVGWAIDVLHPLDNPL